MRVEIRFQRDEIAHLAAERPPVTGPVMLHCAKELDSKLCKNNTAGLVELEAEIAIRGVANIDLCAVAGD